MQGGFAAFISYSQKDARLARRLHLALKTYRVPKGVDVPELGPDRKLGRIFRDDEDMGADPSLHQALDVLVDGARNLIVLCTPNSARSKWVDREIRRFKRRPEPRVFAVIGAGSPQAAAAEEECFAPALKSKFGPDGRLTGEPDEPMAPDLRKEGLDKVCARLAAGILGISFDVLWQHERRRRQRHIALVAALVLLGSSAALLTVLEVSREFDAAALAVQSVQASTDGWRRGGDAAIFARAFRAALAATPLPGSLFDSSTPLRDCALGQPVASGTCALALSGHALASRRLFDERPPQARGNYRDDIEGASGIERRALRLSNFVSSVSFSGDSSRVALFHTDGRLLIFEVAQGRKIFDTRIVDAGRGPVALDQSGEFALLPARSGGFVSVDIANAREVRTPGIESTVHDIKVTGTRRLAVTTQQIAGRAVSKLTMLEPASAASEVELEEFTPYDSNGFSRSGDRFVSYSGNSGERLFIVDVQSRNVQEVKVVGLAQGIGQVKALATDPHAKWVALGGNGSGGTDNVVQVISLADRREAVRLAGHTGEIYSIAFAPRADLIATGASDLSVRLWRRESGQEVARLGGHASDIKHVIISPDGKFLATTASDGWVLLWNMEPLTTPDTSLRARICAGGGGGFDRPGTMVLADERASTPALQGRPWDVCMWRGTGTPSGLVQSARAWLVRHARLRSLDYPQPSP